MSTVVIPRLIAIRKAIDIVNKVASECQSLKIGKTHCISDRMSKDDYKEKYKNVLPLYSSKSKELVSYVEAIFIDACMTELPDLCDNKKDGEDSLNDQMKESDMYYVYIVWR